MWVWGCMDWWESVYQAEEQTEPSSQRPVKVCIGRNTWCNDLPPREFYTPVPTPPFLRHYTAPRRSRGTPPTPLSPSGSRLVTRCLTRGSHSALRLHTAGSRGTARRTCITNDLARWFVVTWAGGVYVCGRLCRHTLHNDLRHPFSNPPRGRQRRPPPMFCDARVIM